MSIEAIPTGYEHAYNPLDQIDHKTVALAAGVRILKDGNTPHNIQYLFALQRQLRFRLVDELYQFGKFVERVEYQDNVLTFDPELLRAKTYMSGTIVALTTLDAMAYEVGIGRDEWRDAWLARPHFISSASEDALRNLDEKEACEAKGDAVIEIGSRELAKLEAPYGELLDCIEDSHPRLIPFSNVFRASFGYVFGAAREAIKDIMLERDLSSSMQTQQELDVDLRTLISCYYNPGKQ